MGKIKKADAKKYADMFVRSKAEDKKKKEWIPYADGKCQAKVESAYWDKLKDWETQKELDGIIFELKILSGGSEGRSIKRKFYIEGKTKEETQANMVKFKTQMSNLGISDLKSPDEVMDSLEECVIEINIWTNQKSKWKTQTPFFNKYVKGPEGEEEEKQQQPVAAVVSANDDSDDIEYD